MSKGYSRKQWQQSGGQDPDIVFKHQADVRDEVSERHEEYLLLLQERNRLKKKDVKDQKQVELQQKEQGFSLYMNGANENLPVNKKNKDKSKHSAKTHRTKPVNPKTAGESRPVVKQDHHTEKPHRAKTAPENNRRKNWCAGSVNLKTDRGEKVKVKAPDYYTGDYEDDFEEDVSDSDSFNSSDSYNSDDEHDEIVVGMQRLSTKDPGNMKSVKHKRPTPAKESGTSDDEGSDDKEQLLLTMKDVKKLRQSLEMNQSIRMSLAQQVDSDSDFEYEDPIAEEPEEDIRYSYSSSPSSSDERASPKSRNSKHKKKDELVVLEFAPSKNKERMEKHLSAARKGDPESYGALRDDRVKSGSKHDKAGARSEKSGSVDNKTGSKVDKSGSRPDKNLPRPHSGSKPDKSMLKPEKSSSSRHGATPKATVLKPGSPMRSSSGRPLSAHRKSGIDHIDTTVEARAVIAALQAENEQFVQHRRDTQSAPGRSQHDEKSPLPEPEKSSDRPLSAALSWKERLKSTAQSPTSSFEHKPPEEGIDNIVQKVLKLDARGQKKLLEALLHLEKGSEGDSPASKAKKPLKAVAPVNDMVKACSRDEIDVHIQLLSNWGHHSVIGLTEIQLFNTNGKRLEVDPSFVKMKGGKGAHSDFANLFNGKCKTVKDRNMWSCRFEHGRPVDLTIPVRKSQHQENIDIARIKIWNYNRSLSELNMGAKDVHIVIGKDSIYEGELDKGCGNQVFDYGKIISVNLPQTMDLIKPSPSRQGSSSAKQGPSQKSDQRVSTPKEERGSSPRLERGSSPRLERRVSSPRLERGSSPRLERGSSPRVERRRSIERSNSLKHRAHSNPPDSGVRKESGRPVLHRRTSQDDNTTPNVDNVSLFHSTEDTARLHHSRSDSRLSSRSEDYIQTDRGSKESGRRLHISKDDRPRLKESNKEPQNRAKRRKEKRNKMAANFSTESTGASVDQSSDTTVSQSLESQKTESKEKSKRSKSKSPPTPDTETPEKPNQAPGALPSHLSPPDGAKSGVSDDEALEGGSMLQQIRKITTANKDGEEGTSPRPSWLSSDRSASQLDSKSGEKSVPSWLNKDDVNLVLTPPADSKHNGEDLLDDWSTNKNKKVTIESDQKDKHHGRRANSRNSNRPPASPRPRNTPRPQKVGDEELLFEDEKDEGLELDLGGTEEDDKEEMTRMKQIESARAQWRKKEEMKLEESWTNLNLFDRMQKGRISLDLQDDILDEYLHQEKVKVKEPPILEESETNHKQHEYEEEEDIIDNDEEDMFCIPELPQGKELEITILTTWGDKHYVGLNGIEIFSKTGEQAVVDKITADPSDINVLPEYNKDPRVVTNLIDGMNRTRDDIHMWLAPYRKGRSHKIFMSLKEPVSIAMMRIWNYNKSRIHSYRGVRDIEVRLDGSMVFRGEITRACGGVMGGSDSFGDTILFTTDEDILELVSQYDQAFEMDLIDLEDYGGEEEQERPSTADGTQPEVRPFTAAANARGGNAPPPVPKLQHHIDNLVSDNGQLVLKGQELRLNFTATWGDVYYLGLTGLEVVGKDGEAIPLNMQMIDADPRDLHVLPGYERDDRTLDKLIDGVNITTSDEHMWMIPFTDGENHELIFKFDKVTEVMGLRFWNYNKSSEDTYRGAKTVHIQLDGRQVSPLEGFLIRKGPGNCYFDFAQEVNFTEPCTPRVVPVKKGHKVSHSIQLDEPSQEYEVLQKPCGFIYQLQLLTTWGDQYYVGLAGLEFFDSEGNKIELTDNNISAYPDSVNCLPNVENDVRTPDKLIDGHNDTSDGSHMWLSPVLPGMLNRVYVIFDSPMEVSMIKLWNYSKTANRGVKDFALLVDDLLVYNGTLDMVTGARGIVPGVEAPQKYHTILFTEDKDIRHVERHTIIKNQAGEQDVQLMNDCQVVAPHANKKASSKAPDQALRPKTSLVRKGVPKKR